MRSNSLSSIETPTLKQMPSAHPHIKLKSMSRPRGLCKKTVSVCQLLQEARNQTRWVLTAQHKVVEGGHASTPSVSLAFLYAKAILPVVRALLPLRHGLFTFALLSAAFPHVLSLIDKIPLLTDTPLPAPPSLVCVRAGTDLQRSSQGSALSSVIFRLCCGSEWTEGRLEGERCLRQQKVNTAALLRGRWPVESRGGIWEVFCCFNWRKQNKTVLTVQKKHHLLLSSPSHYDFSINKGSISLHCLSPRGNAIRHRSSD